MARRALLKARPAADVLLDALFPHKGACLFCATKLEDSDFRPVCASCSGMLLSSFTYESRVPGEFWDRIDGHVAGRIRVVNQDTPGIPRIMKEGNLSAMAEVSKAMATCIPPIRYIRTDGVYMAEDGPDSSRITALMAFGKQLAKSLACDYLGLAGKSGSDWQNKAIAKYTGADPTPSSAYPVLVCESAAVNEAAASLTHMRAKEIIWADADGL